MDINNVAEIFMMVVVTGLGGAKLLEMWQAHKLKTAEKQLDHDFEKENKAINYIIADAERNRLRVEDLENNKFSLMREDVNALLDRMTPCEELLKKLDGNRENATQLLKEVNARLDRYNFLLDYVFGRMRLDRTKIDVTGQVSNLHDSLQSVGNETQERVRTGQFPIQRPNESQ